MKRNIKSRLKIIDNSQDDYENKIKNIYIFVEFTSHQLLLATLKEQALIK